MSLSKFYTPSNPPALNSAQFSAPSSNNISEVSPEGTREALKFLQINLNHTKDANSLLVNYIKENHIDIIAIQDPYLRNGVLFGFPLDWLKHASGDGSAWLVIPNKSLIVNKQQTFKTAAFVTIQTTTKTYIIGSQYCAPSGDINQNINEWIDPLLISNNPNILIMGDFNASAPAWSQNNLNQRGRKLQNFLLRHSLIVFNDPDSPPTYDRDGRLGWIDLLITTNSLRNDIHNWKVLSNFASLSDHHYISFTLNHDPPVIIHSRYQTKFNSHKKFINNFKTPYLRLTNALSTITNSFELETLTEQLLTDLTNTCEISYPKRKHKPQTEFKWWNSNLTCQRNKLNALKRRLIHASPEEKPSQTLIFKRERAKFRRLLSDSKSSAWKQFCESQSQNFGQGFQLAHKKSFQPHHIQAKWSDLGFSSKEEALKKLTSHLISNPPSSNAQLIPIQSAPNPVTSIFNPSHSNLVSSMDDFVLPDGPPVAQSPSSHLQPTTRPPPHSDSRKITVHEINLALNSLNPNKAPGPDGLDFRIIRQLHKHYPKILCKWTNLCFNFNYFPKILRSGEIIYFNKIGKDVQDPNNYRPICLLPTLSKVLEKLIVNRLHFFLENNNIFSQNQYGFRPGKSCEKALSTLTQTVKLNKSNYLHTLAISCDIKRAFDSINREKIIEQMINLNCPTNLTLLVKSYLRDRRVLVNWGIGREEFPSQFGCPQGSCLGPLCWLFVAESFLKNNPDTQDVKTICFADDFLFLIKGKNRRILESHGQNIINKFSNWCNQNNLELSESKTLIMTFTHNRNILKRKPTIRLNNKSLKHTSELKFLGLTFNRTLTWVNHIDNLYKKITLFGNNYNSFSSLKWGINGNLLKTWYQTVIERIVLYGASIWGHNLNKNEIKKLNSLQRIFLLKITRTYRTAPTYALHILAGLPPLHLALKKEAVTQTLTHLQIDSNWHSTTFKKTDYQSYSDKQFLHPSDKYFPQTTNYLKDPTPRPHSIYTDGSKSDLGTGAAFIHFHNNLKISHWTGTLNKSNSSFQAEYIAIDKALNYIKHNNIKDVNLFTDSRSTIEAIINPNQRNKDINKIQILLNNLKNTKFKLQIYWIKAHVGLTGNEEADILAKSATLGQQNIFIPYPKSSLKSSLQKIQLISWQSEWDSAEKGRYTHSLIPVIKQHFCSFSFPVNCFLTEHGPFPEYLFAFKRASSPYCICGELGTGFHYLTQCNLTKKFHLKLPTIFNITSWIDSIKKSRILQHKLRHLIEWLIDNQTLILSPT